jgi:ubiquinone/menaquinone biosynthesis C-methylase UbiE
MTTKEKNETACCEPECCSQPALQDPHEIKNVVKERYSKIANQSKAENETSCCGTGCCDTVDYSVFALDYTRLKGYNPDADLGLGCGLPTEFAQIKEGDTVVDLGSGAGNDVFIARAITGETGKVIGVDFTMAMIKKANENNAKLGFKNVEFKYGDIEKLPVENNTADVIVSNCVLNLVPDKDKAFSEIFRVLKPGGHISVSDIVTSNELPKKIRAAANLYAGCIGGALVKEDYIAKMKNTGLENIEIQKERIINIPDQILLDYLTVDELNAFKRSGINILSVNVYAQKP